MLRGMNLIGGGAGEAGGFQVKGVTLNGSDNTYSRGAAYTSVSDTKEIILSFWWKRDVADQGDDVWGSATPGYYVATPAPNNGNKFTCRWANSTNTQKLEMTTTNAFSDTASWHHTMYSVNTNSGVADSWIAVDGVNQGLASQSVTTDGIFDLTNFTNWHHFNDGVTGAYWDGDVAELYINTDASLDLSVAANIERFRSTAGKPVDLGVDGSTPTGSQPTVYQSVAADGAASDFATNLGYGGGMTENGTTVALASTSPTD